MSTSRNMHNTYCKLIKNRQTDPCISASNTLLIFPSIMIKTDTKYCNFNFYSVNVSDFIDC